MVRKLIDIKGSRSDRESIFYKISLNALNANKSLKKYIEDLIESDTLNK